MSELDLSPTDDAVEDYYDQLDAYERVGAQHEGAVRTAFRDLLDHGGTQMGWELVPEWSPKHRRIRIDGALLDEYSLTHGFWEAKDSDDDLDREIQNKLDKGYPADNTIFKAPNRAVLITRARWAGSKVATASRPTTATTSPTPPITRTTSATS